MSGGDEEDDAWYATGETTDGRPLQPFVTLPIACGAIRAGAMVVTCECGLIRQHDRPCDYVADVQLAGWFCHCGIFNGEEKERLIACRTCSASRPI